MKICIINNIFYPYSRGGADKIAKIMADGFIADNDEVFVIATKPRKNQLKPDVYHSYFLPSFFDDLKNMPVILRLAWHFFDMFDIINYFKVRKILQMEKPELVITHNLKGLGYLIPRAISGQGIKHFHVLHDIQLIHPSGLVNFGEEKKLDSLFCKIYTGLSAFLFRKINIVISPSGWLLDFHRDKNIFSNIKSYVIPNPVLISGKIIEGRKEAIPTFIFVGEMEKHKGVEFLLAVIKEINKEKLICRINFVGAGSLSELLKKEMKTSDFIKYLGKLENKEVLKMISSAHALIMPSLCYENSPTVIYEACSQKIPVIASRIGGIPELVHEFGGILFAPGDKNDLIKKIYYLINNYDMVKSKGDESSGKLEKYSTKKYIKKIKNILNKKAFN